MRKFLVFTTLTLAASSVAAQQQQPAQKEKPPAPTAKKGESDLERRLRTEGAAGGTAPVPKEQRKAVGAGAKPHMHFDQIDRGMHRRSDAEVITPAE
jgi:hypothetical protein